MDGGICILKTIGILGGMGSYATADFFKRIIDVFPAEKEWDRPRILIDNNCVMPSRVRAILYHEKVDELIQQMQESVNSLSNSGADMIVIGCMTAHHFIEYLPHQEKMINVTKLLEKEITEKEVFVLCTEGSMDANVWDNALPNINRLYPDEHQMLELRKYIEIVKTGKVDEEEKASFTRFINELSCETILLGCTELPILVKEDLLEKKLYDPLKCAIEYLKENV